MDILFQTILPFVGILVALIVIHELGHYFTAKLTGVKVLEAGIGYPPRVWGFTWRDTIYSINLLPLGGFVRLLGEEDPTDPQSLASKPRWIRLIVLASGSGMNFILPIFLFAAIFIIPRDVSVGLTQITSVVQDAPASQAEPVILPDGLDPDEATGLRAGDVIVAVNGNETRNPAEVGRQIRLNLGETITMTVRRALDTGEVAFIDYRMEARWSTPDIVHTVEPGDTVSSVSSLLGIPWQIVLQAADIEYRLTEGQQLTIPDADGTIAYEVQDTDTVALVARRLGVTREAVRLAAGLPDPEALTPGQELRIAQGPTGITIATWNPAFIETESFPPWEAVPKGLSEYGDTLVLFRNEVVSWFSGGSSPQFAGPVGIAQATGEIVDQSGWIALLELAALLSFNLGIINILPLPMLDGGRIAFVLLEIIRGGRRIAPEKEAIVHLVGLALIISLAVGITVLDVQRIIGGESLFR
ncbi:MAG: site-2 protease family protein [Chloroflexi bacterium]|nr:site-2 protease family protein [Chloroflexota bacterium]